MRDDRSLHDDPRNLDLEAAIAADPDDLAALQVYADWLLERRDPRCELIALQCAGAPQVAIDELVDRHATYLLGPLARYRTQLTWGIGYIRSFDLASCHVKKSAVVPLLQHPSLRFLTELKLSGTRGLEAVPPSLRALELGDAAGADLTSVAPRLTKLTVHGDWTSDDLEFPFVETAHFESFGQGTGHRLAQARWPRLTSLTLGRCGTAPIEQLLARLPGLRTLRLELVYFVDRLCAQLAASPFTPHLTTLAFWRELSDRGASALLDGRFASLATLELIETQVSADGIELLRASGFPVELVHWSRRRDWMIVDG